LQDTASTLSPELLAKYNRSGIYQTNRPFLCYERYILSAKLSIADFAQRVYEESGDLAVLEIGMGEGRSALEMQAMFPRARITGLNHPMGGQYLHSGGAMVSTAPEAFANVAQHYRIPLPAAHNWPRVVLSESTHVALKDLEPGSQHLVISQEAFQHMAVTRPDYDACMASQVAYLDAGLHLLNKSEGMMMVTWPSYVAYESHYWGTSLFDKLINTPLAHTMWADDYTDRINARPARLRVGTHVISCRTAGSGALIRGACFFLRKMPAPATSTSSINTTAPKATMQMHRTVVVTTGAALTNIMRREVEDLRPDVEKVSSPINVSALTIWSHNLKFPTG